MDVLVGPGNFHAYVNNRVSFRGVPPPPPRVATIHMHNIYIYIYKVLPLAI